MLLNHANIDFPFTQLRIWIYDFNYCWEGQVLQLSCNFKLFL